MSSPIETIKSAAGLLMQRDDSKRFGEAVKAVSIAVSAECAKSKDQGAWARCSAQSIVSAIAWCARNNLMPGSSPPTVYLIPQDGQLQARITHVGYAVLAVRAGVRLRSIPVAAADDIEVEFGLAVAHRPANLESEPQKLEELAGVIVCVDYGDRQPEVRLWVPRSVIQVAKTASRSNGGPWSKYPIPMARAAAIRACFRRGDIVADRMHIPDEEGVILEAEAEAVTRSPGGRLAAAEARMLEGPADLWEGAPEALEAAAREPAQEAR
jgi:recombinational DNA repair protein RecT